MKTGRIDTLLHTELRNHFDMDEVADLARVSKSTLYNLNDLAKVQTYSSLFRIAAAMGYRIHISRSWTQSKRTVWWGWLEYVGAGYYE